MGRASLSPTFTALPEHIDVYGHVNNAVWVRWMEDLATAHWTAVARPQDLDAYAWFVTRHEIDYRGNIAEGESCTGTTEIREGPSGARFDRYTTFRDDAGKVLVNAKTTWAMIDRASGRLMRVPAEVAEPFLPARA
ncbi:acyl-CoA thioesterase [Croceibacterium aestuarii]|uniref:acyl-CoA thioesterase n=1 Tax=Croceibacterium aestuarii TaxID=3064139 RepID=UPI00272E8DED|nr:acyl-CoA thioesterase [Croceibacterium sp. D39]